ncbi:uncharacterized protein STEHIDRAFT_129856 [Stereum hirsutum FP-91666 SS1]|uniref:uncharacterized protein n=1 Tax=Stereum hirsutum (strain FP-91666) TaxID=721885 RepID=UPI000440BEEF|nr:uncharacterized protein STEHIDRAFT_129856 [Stereum hirsutum FP-91666 SS1]EIM87800.1 hypothetical protein STEHIDRAFT_129856 [Stereum hirsutum FP-91666 SS1]
MPVDLSPPSSLDEAFMIASAAQKYDMRSAMERSRGLLRNFVSDSNCIRAYGTAYRLRLREEMIMAVPLTLRRDLSLSSLGVDLRHLTGSALYDLWVYRATCAKVISKFIDQKISNGDGAEWLPRGHSTSASRGCISTIMRTSIPAWYHAFVGQIALTMAEDPEQRFPSRSQKLDSLISACQDHSKHCRYCLEKYDHVDVYRQMWAKLMDTIDEVIAQVDLAKQFSGF